jgi:hypothetical protein
MRLGGKSKLWSEIFSKKNVHERNAKKAGKKKQKRHRCAKES